VTDIPAFPPPEPTPPERPAPTRRELRHAAPRERHVLRWVIVGIVLLLLAWVLWIGIRGLIARDQLTGAIPLVSELKSQALSGDTAGLQPVADELAHRASTAAALTSDPIWRATEIIPGVGPNLTAFRQSAQVVDEVTSDVMPPILDLAQSLDFGAFLPKDGAIDLDAISALEPKLDAAGAAMASAQELAGTIDVSGTVPQIGDAVRQLVAAVQDAGSLVVGLDQTVKTLPAMLGADGPQRLLLLVQNNAELRATGGIPGAVVELSADHGRIDLVTETSAGAMGVWPSPVVPLTGTEETLYSDRMARYMQNVTMTPDFARSAEIATAMWKDVYGEDVDAVISVDPVALSYVLKATGPVTLPDGTRLTSDDVVQTLLSDVYARYADPADQDRFFAAAAGSLFEAVMSFHGDAKAFLGQLAQAVSERRVYAWSADAAVQSVIAGGALGALAPHSDASSTGIGVYLVDNTQSKMDWYLRPEISVGSIACPAWGDHPYFVVHVRLTDTAPADGAGLPAYVTGGGNGTKPGEILTTIYLTLPSGSVIQSVERNDVKWAYIDGGDDGTALRVGYTDLTAPGGTTDVEFAFFGPVGAPTGVNVVHTPTAGDVPVSVGDAIACPAAPIEPTNPGVNAMTGGR